MKAVSFSDGIFLYSIIIIWMMLLLNIVLTVAGHLYYLEVLHEKPLPKPKEYPFVSVMVPAHNEEKVIVRTVESLLHFDYPAERYEVIIINDNSSDNTGKILAQIQKKYSGRNLKIITTDAVTGGKGKSNALNIGFQQSCGELIAVYDADNTPEHPALRLLVEKLLTNSKLGAVIGKFRTRNRSANLLTRFINIETLTFQWMAQAGRWKLLKLCTIPGTNFVIRRSILSEIGGWDIKAIAEDTEISFRIYRMGYKIQYYPPAVTWEQEPQTLSVWMKQRTRWAAGNFYVLIKNLRLIFTPHNVVKFDVLYFFAVYFLFLSSIILSDICCIGGAFGMIHLTLQGSSVLVWVMAYAIFVLSVATALLTEKGEADPSNLLLILIMYFTYCQLWMLVSIGGFFAYLRNAVLHRQMRWYKTERF